MGGMVVTLNLISYQMLQIKFMSASCEIALK